MPQIWKPSGGLKRCLGGQPFALRRLQVLELSRNVIEGEAHQPGFRSADGPGKIAATAPLPDVLKENRHDEPFR